MKRKVIEAPQNVDKPLFNCLSLLQNCWSLQLSWRCLLIPPWFSPKCFSLLWNFSFFFDTSSLQFPKTFLSHNSSSTFEWFIWSHINCLYPCGLNEQFAWKGRSLKPPKNVDKPLFNCLPLLPNCWSLLLVWRCLLIPQDFHQNVSLSYEVLHTFWYF